MSTFIKRGPIKQTLVTVTANGQKRTFLLNLEHKPDGGAILPQHTVDNILSKMKVRRGDTYSVA
jgi:hypothetical protein